MKKPYIKELTLEEGFKLLKKNSPDLYETAKNISHNKKHKFFFADYPYGSELLCDGGDFQVPNAKGGFDAISSNETSKYIKQHLGYNMPAIPLGVVLGGRVELCRIRSENYIETFNVYTAGQMFAVKTVIDRCFHGQKLSYQARNIWLMTSGARTPYLLYPLSNKVYFNKLRKDLKLKSYCPHNMLEQRGLFTELANHSELDISWGTQVLFFSNEWVLPNTSDAWKLFHLAILVRSWKISGYDRNRHSLEEILNDFFGNKSGYLKRGHTSRQYLMDMFKHIVECSLGSTPLFKIDNQNRSGPFNEIIKILLEYYNLLKLSPLMMTPDIFTNKNDIGYIPLKLTTKLIERTRRHPRDRIINDERDCLDIISSFKNEIHDSNLPVTDTPFINLLDMDHEFFHNRSEAGSQIASSSEIFTGSLQAVNIQNKNKNMPFWYQNEFLGCCVKISKKVKK